MPKQERSQLDRVADLLHHIENAFYVLIAIALAMAGAALFLDTLAEFTREAGERPLKVGLLAVLDGLLLVFIVSELLHTVRRVIDELTLRPEPFLMVGIVAVIRRLIVISAEAPDFIGDPEFSDVMIEMGVLVGAAVGLGATILLLRLGRSPEQSTNDTSSPAENDTEPNPTSRAASRAASGAASGAPSGDASGDASGDEDTAR